MEIKKHDKYSDNLEATAAAIAALADEIWREHYTPIIGMAQVEYMLGKYQSAEQIYTDIKKNNYVYFTAKYIEHDKPIGYCAIQPKDDFLFLSKMYVHKDYRGRSISRNFIEEVTAFCRREYGFDKIRLTVNKTNNDSIAAYKKIGFGIIDSIKTDIGGGFFMDDYVMELLICP